MRHEVLILKVREIDCTYLLNQLAHSILVFLDFVDVDHLSLLKIVQKLPEVLLNDVVHRGLITAGLYDLPFIADARLIHIANLDVLG